MPNEDCLPTVNRWFECPRSTVHMVLPYVSCEHTVNVILVIGHKEKCGGGFVTRIGATVIALVMVWGVALSILKIVGGVLR